MPYLVVYDHLFDKAFQCEVSDAEAVSLRRRDSFEVYDDPRPNLPIKSRFRSDRHPDWADDDVATESK